MPVYEAVRAAVGEWCTSHGYAPSADAFSFDGESHVGGAAYYCAPRAMSGPARR